MLSEVVGMNVYKSINVGVGLNNLIRSLGCRK